MNYHWSKCPGCGCDVTINYTSYADRLSGSLRRWSSDRSINDGRKLEILRSDLGPGGSFATPCVCGQEITVTSDAVSADRDSDFRVKLSSD